ncbi:MAG: uroporphyrinogen decarboxylase family protein [Verrucomicrobiae bacterium]|nr:uroporphyrinogen decarboxylase family protein [Verrucomicrobiae bacterium]
MKQILREAFDHPDRGGIFYSADGVVPKSRRLSGLKQWDWTPSKVHRVEGVTTCFFPLALGCKPTRTSQGTPWIEKMIRDPAQVLDLIPPKINGEFAGEILRRASKLVEDLPPDGQIRILDVQSPLGVAELMWDHSFYFALVEHPDAVHELLGKITRFIIDFVKAFQQIAGARLNPCGFPKLWSDGPGTMVADDTMSLVSPEMHREFSVPYLNQLAAECGPLYYHSCTWRAPYFDNIRQIKNVRAYNWNPGNSDDPAVLNRAFGGKALLVPHLVIDGHCEPDALKHSVKYADEFEFFKHQVESAPKNVAQYFWFSNICEKGAIMEKIYDYLHARGHTPAAHGLDS